VLSEVLKHDLIEIFDIQEEKISVIPPMFPENEKIHTGKENEIQQFLLKEGISKKYILSVGELREYKNIPRLLQAYNIFLKESGEDIDLVLVGKEDPTYHEVRSTIIQLGLQNRVHIYNMLDVTQMRLLYPNALFFVLSSLYESSELVLLMAMAYELPMASAILPSITNILSKEDVVFFRPMSIPDIQSAFMQVLIKPL
jgi:glycosyltransferase involved in cell wall biosynthesis